MNGQTEEELIHDLENAISLGINNIDIYPINNVVTQPKLHKIIIEKNLPVTSSYKKLSMGIIVDSLMRSQGFMPHNGHGFVKVKNNTNAVVTDEYSFVYHEHVYGYEDEDKDILGFGVGAVSNLRGLRITNTDGRERYIKNINQGNILSTSYQFDLMLERIKPLVLRLPYHGVVDKSKISKNIPDGLRIKLNELIDNSLVIEDDNSYKLTKIGWFWYVNIMYYLMPMYEKAKLDKLIIEELRTPGKFISTDEIIFKEKV